MESNVKQEDERTVEEKIVELKENILISMGENIDLAGSVIVDVGSPKISEYTGFSLSDVTTSLKSMVGIVVNFVKRRMIDNIQEDTTE